MRALRIPGFLSYALVGLWFLLTLTQARAQQDDALAILVANALADKGAPAGATIEIDFNSSLITDGFDPLGAQMDGASYNASVGRFVLRFKSDAGTAVVVGDAVLMASVPALNRSINPGETITESDLDWAEVKDTHKARYITDPSRLLGKTARRALSADKPIRKNDIAASYAVRKGDLITLVMELPGMRLTNRAISLQRGEIGDAVTVRSLNGDRVVSGVVTAKGIVSTASGVQDLSGELTIGALRAGPNTFASRDLDRDAHTSNID